MDIHPDIKALIERLEARLSQLEQEYAEYRQWAESRISQLEEENADLRRRLGLDSSNSSKPPSSDGLKKKPRTTSLRDKSGKKSGGQKGHKGNNLQQVETPDKIEHHDVCECAHCQAKLDASNVVGSRKRQVFDIPEPRLEVTEHVAGISKCPVCGKITKADFPEGVNAPVQYGERIKSAAVYFNVQQLIPEDRTADIMTDLFSAPSLCPASIASWAKEKAKQLEPVIKAIQEKLKASHTRHLDETGFRIGGKTQWLHTVSSTALTCYFATEKRGDIPIFLQDAGGVIVHDHFKPYYKTLAELLHALCNAHHLRELKALIEHDKEAWANEMHWLLMLTNSFVREAKAKGHTALLPSLLECIVELYDLIVDAGLAYHRSLPPPVKKSRTGQKKRRPGHNLLRRLRDFKEDVLRFAHDFRVPFTNNLAEQDIRMMKVRMKISGCFRTMEGAQTFATLRSVISTARKQGWNILKTLSAAPECIIRELRIVG